jgi:ubiquinone/menaquinone biosynthesis C-methylase UbiE
MRRIPSASKRNARPHHVETAKRRTSNAYDRWAHVWNLARCTNGSIYRTALSLLDETHERVLDVGCGTGLMSARLTASGRRVTGIDLSAAMIARARRRRGVNHEFIEGDAENLPVASGSFDAVVNLISFHHYPNPTRALAEFHRVLRPGGRLVLIAFDRQSRYITLTQRTNRWTRDIAGESWQKTSEEALALVRAAGFANVEIRPVQYWIKTFAVVAESGRKIPLCVN